MPARIVLFLTLCLVPGCFQSADEISEAPAAEEQRDQRLPGPDDSECPAPGGIPLEPTCHGLDCARDEPARHFLELLQGVLEEAGVADEYTIVEAKSNGPDFIVEYVVTIGWFRGVTAWVVPGGDDAAIVTYLQQSACLELPSIETFDHVVETARACHPQLGDRLCCVGPSPNNGCRPVCVDGWSEDVNFECLSVTTVEIDAGTAEIAECEVDQLACF